jgi:lysozyme family protein
MIAPSSPASLGWLILSLNFFKVHLLIPSTPEASLLAEVGARFHHYQVVSFMSQVAAQSACDPQFQKALQFVLRWEGGFVDDPDDHGGRTNKGITQRVYDAYRTNRRLPAQDVKGISDEETSAIYFEQYWLAAKCDHLDPELGMMLFDTAVNLGDRHALLLMQEATGCRSADGVYGPQTQAAWDSCSVPDAAARFCMLREEFYRDLANKPGQGKFLNGWLNRLNALREELGIPVIA